MKIKQSTYKCNTKILLDTGDGYVKQLSSAMNIAVFVHSISNVYNPTRLNSGTGKKRSISRFYWPPLLVLMTAITSTESSKGWQLFLEDGDARFLKMSWYSRTDENVNEHKIDLISSLSSHHNVFNTLNSKIKANLKNIKHLSWVKRKKQLKKHTNAKKRTKIIAQLFYTEFQTTNSSDFSYYFFK